jgi:hypothetical protein
MPCRRRGGLGWLTCWVKVNPAPQAGIPRIEDHIRCGASAFRELDEALGLTEAAGEGLVDPRTGRNGQHGMVGLFQQSIFGRLGNYENVNDAERHRTPRARSDHAMDRRRSHYRQASRFGEPDGTLRNRASGDRRQPRRPCRSVRALDRPGSDRRPPKKVLLGLGSSASPTMATGGHGLQRSVPIQPVCCIRMCASSARSSTPSPRPRSLISMWISHCGRCRLSWRDSCCAHEVSTLIRCQSSHLVGFDACHRMLVDADGTSSIFIPGQCQCPGEVSSSASGRTIKGKQPS